MRRAGFTLIELLIVMAIIGVLAALLFPVLASARAAAKDAVCVSNLRSLGAATGLYRGDNDQRYPAWCNHYDRVAPDLRFGRPKEWNPAAFSTPVELLQPYIRATEVFRCPLDSGATFANRQSRSPFHADNGGSSYLFAELLEGQNPDSWSQPSREIWALDASDNWLGQSGVSLGNALYYDLHVGRYRSRMAPQWMETEWQN